MDRTLVVAEALESLLRGLEQQSGEGVVRQIMGPVVDVAFTGSLPAIGNLLRARERTGGLPLEAVQLMGEGMIRAIALDCTDGLERGTPVFDTGAPICVPVGPDILGRVFNVLGEPIDRRGSVAAVRYDPVRREPVPYARIQTFPQVFETGLKAVDLLTPFPRGGKIALFGGIGERTRGGNDLWLEMQATGVLPRAVLAFGQMNEPPGARFRVPFTALTMAEYFRDDRKQDVLLFFDNIYRYVQAGLEVSLLRARIPSEVGYQPTLQSEIGALQERIASVEDAAITSVQAVYVPADDLADPGPASVTWRSRSRRGPTSSAMVRCRTSSPFLAWRSSPTKTRRSSCAHAACRNSSRNRSSSPTSSREWKAATSRLKRRSAASSSSATACMTTSPSRRSTWSAPSTRRSRRPGP